MERKTKMGWGALRVVGLIYTPLGAFFLILGGFFWHFLPQVRPLALTFLPLGGIFFLLGVVFLAVEHGKKRRMDALVQAGHFVWAEVVDCVCNYNVGFHNGRHPYQIVACYETGGKKHVFRSQSLSIPAPHDLVGKPVRVYADADFKHYYVDVEPLLGNYVEY